MNGDNVGVPIGELIKRQWQPIYDLHSPSSNQSTRYLQCINLIPKYPTSFITKKKKKSIEKF